MTLALLLVLAQPYPANPKVKQGVSADGGTAWAMEGTVTLGGLSGVNVFDGGILQQQLQSIDTKLAAPLATTRADGGVVASEESLQRIAIDITLVRQLLEQLVQLQQQQQIQLQALKDPVR
jgi:hypothetical protein